MLHELRVHQIELEMQNENLRRTQAELDAARARYFDLYDLAPVGYCTVSEKGLILEANLTAAKLLGWERKQLVKQPLTSFIHNEDQDVYYLQRKQLFESGAPQVCELRMLNKEGNHFWARLDATVVQEGMDGTPVCRVVMSDISERKRAEENLVKSKDLLSETEKTGKIGGWVFDAEKLTQNWTEETFRILEIDLTEGEPKVPEGVEFIAPAFRPMAMQAIQRALEHGEPYDQKWEIITAKGNRRWVHAVAKAYQEQGKTKRVSGSFQDITERKRAESQREAALEALRESEERYRTLFTSSSDPIMLIEPFSGKFISGNQTTMEMFGLKNDDDFSSFGPWDFSPERQPDERASAEKAKEMNKIAMRDGSNFFEWAHKRLNGEEFSANVRLTRMVLDKKTILQATVRDITEYKRAEEKIRNSLVEKEILLKEVHHRVKNNLMTIIGLIKMQEKKANNDMFTSLLLELESRVHAMALVHESLHKSADLAHVNLQNYIETMSDNIRDQFGVNRDIRFSVQAAGVDVGLDIAVPYGLILNELLTNVFKHAFPDGRPGSGAGNCEINVIVNQEGGMNVLTVADNGVGLPVDLDWEKSETIGLRLIKMLSQQINGSIELDRSAGTTFRLRFAKPSCSN